MTRILTNHIGYNKHNEKGAVLECGPAEVSGLEKKDFRLIDIRTEKPVFTGRIGRMERVPGWKGRFFHRLDFSSLSRNGVFRIEISGMENRPSYPFTIGEGLLSEECISDILFYLKSQRSGWKWDQADRNAPFFGERTDRVDVHGGWYDASGDYSKYLSHLSYANYLNPQQIPLVVWSLLTLRQMPGTGSKFGGSLLEERALEEALWGADFLMRMQDDTGYFYMTLFDQWDKNPENRMICAFRGKEGIRLENFKAGFRQGGGMSIAALAAASRNSSETAGISGKKNSLNDYSPREYLAAAEKGYAYLLENNISCLDNRRENIIDYYCALSAAVELFRTTGNDYYLNEGRSWVKKLVECFSRVTRSFLVEADSDRPFFHASDAGLPLLSLVHYIRIEKSEKIRRKYLDLTEDLVRGELALLSEVFNPFMLARQRVKSVDGPVRTSFFIPHDNESGYWWQGENARLASLSCAMREAAYLLVEYNPDDESLDDLFSRTNEFADSQLDWILGLNPFDICMLQGKGRNNPKYEDDKLNSPGGICNGITSGFEDEDDIDFLPEKALSQGDNRWRWSEQWIPHAAWFLMALGACRGNPRG